MQNYRDRGGSAETDNTLRDLHNFSYDAKAEFNNCFIIHSIHSFVRSFIHSFIHNLRKRCIFDVISSLNTKFVQIWSSVTGYGELNVWF